MRIPTGFRPFVPRTLLVLALSAGLHPFSLKAQSGETPPTRWQASYTPTYTEDFEATHPGIQLMGPGNAPGTAGSAIITADPSMVIAGTASARIGWFGKLVTVPSVWPLAGGNTYIVEFQYHILNAGTAFDILHLDLQPVGTTDTQLQVNFAHMQLTAPGTGTYSAGGYLPGNVTYVLTITAQQQTDIVIDNLTIYQQNSVATATTPASWAKLESLPFPRLGKYQGETYEGYDATAPSGSPYTLQEIANTIAFFDVQYGVPIYAQTELPEEIRTARELNPNAVILPYRITEEQGTDPAYLGNTSNSNVSLDYEFLQSVQPCWYLRTAEGTPVFETAYPDVVQMNISNSGNSLCGSNYTTTMLKWLNTEILPSGVWDGLFLDNFLGSINVFTPNYQNPALLDVSINNDGTRSTPAQVSEMTKAGSISIVKQFREANLDNQLIIGNVGAQDLDPYVNGFLQECVTQHWNPPGTSNFSPMGWRAAFDAYQGYQATARRPRIMAFEGCGPVYNYPGTTGLYPLPTAADIVSHRFTMGTALLGDGFYSFDLHGSTSPPLWFDEYSVNSTGTAVYDVKAKGYLGQALMSATELAGPSAPVLQDGFENASLSAAWRSGQGAGTSVTVSNDPGEVISGSASLVLSNPNHTQSGGVSVSTNPTVVQFATGKSYLLTFDWRILETVDTLLGAAISIDPRQPLDVYTAPGRVAGEHGTAHVPFTVPGAGLWSASIYVVNGGKVAIDNVTITEGNVGPWRRDFENGFVLVNPLADSQSFSASDLAGTLNRTGIHRIAGTQAPDVNNGQPVTGSLTLNSFDAIILLADHISVPPAATAPPVIRTVVTASGFGALSSIAPGSWVEIYGSNLSASRRPWAASDFNGSQSPTSLDGISVLIGGRPAYISYISPGQINALVASDAAIGPMQVVVSGPTGTSTPYLVTIQPTEPGLLATAPFQIGGIQYAVATFPDGLTYVLPPAGISGLPSRPAKPGDIITLYGVGFGQVSPNLLAGTLVSAPNSLTEPVQILVGNTRATTQYAGLAPTATGLYQFNITVPNVTGGVVPLTFNLNGVPGTQTLYLALQN